MRRSPAPTSRARARVVAVLTVVTVLVAVVAGIAPVEALPLPPGGATEGTALPMVPEPPNRLLGEIVSASPGYAVLTYGPDSTARHRPGQLIRLSDGAAVRDLNLNVEGGIGQPRLAGDSVVTPNPDATALATIASVTITSAATGQQTAAMKTPAGDEYLGAGPTWLLSALSTDPTTSSPPSLLRLTAPSGTVTSVTGIPAIRSAQIMAADASTVLVTSYELTGTRLWTVDLATATGSLVSDAVFPDSWAVLTPHRIAWQPLSGNPFGKRAIAWRTRAGGPVQDATITDTFGFVEAYGDDLALIDGCCDTSTITPVDLDTATVKAPLTKAASVVRATTDGTLVALLGDTPTGRMVTITPDGVIHGIRSMPALGRPAQSIGLSDGHLTATFSSYFVPGTTILDTPLTAPSWKPSPVASLADQNPGDQDFVAVSGDLILSSTRLPAQAPDQRHMLSWPGGSRRLGTSEVHPLGRGGQLVAVRRNLPGAPLTVVWDVQDARTGAVKATLPFNTPLAIDGGWVWQGPDSAGDLVGKDVLGGSTRTVRTAVCPGDPYYSSLQVAGRWATVTCGTGSWVVDLLGTEGTRPLPSEANTRLLSLGAGFVAWATTLDPNVQASFLAVQDLNAPAHPVRYFGPAFFNFANPDGNFAPDMGSGRGLAYLDDYQKIRSADLSWLTAGTRPGGAATPVPSLSAGPRVTANASARVQIATADTYPVQGYDVRVRAAAPGRPFGAWSYPASWQSTASTSVARGLVAGSDTCFSAREHDAFGVTSEWGSPVCVARSYDDSELTGHGRFRRETASDGRSLTALTSNGSSLTKDSQRAVTVVLTVWRGPGQGSVAVSIGGRSVGTVRLGSATAKYQTVTLTSPSALTGTLTLTSVSAAPARIDAVALTRS